MENKHLWTGLLIGALLTGALIWFLYQQVVPVTQPLPVNTDHTTQPDQNQQAQSTPATTLRPGAASATAVQPAVSAPARQAGSTTEPESATATRAAPQGVATESTTAVTSQKPVSQVSPPVTPEPVAKVTAEALGLPEGLNLSAEELAQLTAAERAKYDEMLASYQEVRNKVLQLHQEREQLKQRMDKVLQQNAGVEAQLETMRQQLQPQ